MPFFAESNMKRDINRSRENRERVWQTSVFGTKLCAPSFFFSLYLSTILNALSNRLSTSHSPRPRRKNHRRTNVPHVVKGGIGRNTTFFFEILPWTASRISEQTAFLSILRSFIAGGNLTDKRQIRDSQSKSVKDWGVCACVCACVRVCVRACVREESERESSVSNGFYPGF